MERDGQHVSVFAFLIFVRVAKCIAMSTVDAAPQPPFEALAPFPFPFPLPPQAEEAGGYHSASSA